MRSPISMMVDAACARQLLAEVGFSCPSHPGGEGCDEIVMPWILEGYTIDETAEGILSNAGIIVPNGEA